MKGRGGVWAIAILLGCGGTDSAGVDASADARCNVSACDNCIDDDLDGAIDGADVHCATAWDDDEGSFGFGIPDFIHDPRGLDCYVDGNTGPGDDGCELHLCCVLGATSQAECDQLAGDLGFSPGDYDPDVDCAVSAGCRDVCEPLVAPACDCFGCCNLCSDAGCFDVLTHDLSSGCDIGSLDDPSVCLPCVPQASCASRCGDTAECTTSADCGAGQWCARGCCVDIAE